MKQIFPKEIIENTAEVHEFKHTTKSKIIYLILLLSLIGMFLALPFFKVDVYSAARGIIKPDKERVVLSVINSGRVLYSNLTNNQKVSKGDTLLIIDDNGIINQLELNTYQNNELALFIEDITTLLNDDKKELQTAKYQRVFVEYQQKMQELQTRFKRIKLDFKRYQTLYQKKVVAAAEFETKKLEYDIALGEMSQFKKQQESLWQADLIQYKNQLEELHSNEVRLNKSKSQFVVLAPISGTLLNVKPQEIGSFINIGAQLGEISPDTDLLVECYVNPMDIGLLQSKTPIKFQVDAYNYNQWGFATGKIIEISKDIEVLDNQPVFRVRCKMDQQYLQLKNGFRGNLKKGMTLNANFKLVERSLYDLLYDKMDDWLNPSRNQQASL